MQLSHWFTVKLLCLFAGLTSKPGMAQVLEDFSDLDLTVSPTWEGDLNKFKTLEGKLQSQSAVTNDKWYLATPSEFRENSHFEVFVNLQFNTSSLNYVDVFLSSDSAKLTGNNSGYFIRMGGTNDEICLYKKNQSQLSLLIDGRNGTTNRSNSAFKLKVIYTNSHQFMLFTDSTGTGHGYTLQGLATDSDYTNNAYLGMVIKQSTSSFFNRHFFDDLYYGKIINDTNKPFVKQHLLPSADTLRIQFSETIKSESLIPNNFTIDNGIDHPVLVGYLPTDSSWVELIIPNKLLSHTIYDLTIKNCKDKANNIMLDTVFNVRWIEGLNPTDYDLVINECMADPDPSVGLPNEEYIELFNRSSTAIQLNGCRIGDKTAEGKLTEYVLEPDSFIIICHPDHVPLFTPFGKVMGVIGFPSLNNADDEILLRNKEGTILHRMVYNLNAYGNTSKSNGGWSLEIKNPLDPCGLNNITASTDLNGGTPGKRNSVHVVTSNADKIRLEKIILKSDLTIQLHFNTTTDSSSVVNPTNYSISNQSIKAVVNNLNVVDITLTSPLVPGQTYSLNIRNIKNCMQRVMPDTTIQISLPENPVPGDVVINEILFNPASGGSDFVEIYNRSTKILTLKGLSLFHNDQNNLPSDLKRIDTTGLLMLPGEFKVFCSNPIWLKNTYKHSEPLNFKALSSLPPMSDDEGHIGLMDAQNIILDEVHYKESMHLPLLIDFEGVSLERISYDISSSEVSNFTSAAASYGFATPGLINSHAYSTQPATDWLSISPNLFSPDEDGHDDIAGITITTPSNVQHATVIIFDPLGQVITTLVNNMPVGNTQTFFWDGTNDRKQKAGIGIYIVYAELFGLDGKKQRVKKTITLGGR